MSAEEAIYYIGLPALIALVVFLTFFNLGKRKVRSHYAKTGAVISRSSLAFYVFISVQAIAIFASIPFLIVGGWAVFGLILVALFSVPLSILALLVTFIFYKPLLNRFLRDVPHQQQEVPPIQISQGKKMGQTVSFIVGGVIFFFSVSLFASVAPRILYSVSESLRPSVVVSDDCMSINIHRNIDKTKKLQGANEQAACLKDKIALQAKTSEPIDCDAIRNLYTEDDEKSIYRINSLTMCMGLQTLQKAILERNPLICDQIPSEFVKDAYQPNVKSGDYDYEIAEMHASCVIHFIGTPTWKEGCLKYLNTKDGFSNYYYKKLAQCAGDAQVRTPDVPYYEKMIKESGLPIFYYTTPIEPHIDILAENNPRFFTTTQTFWDVNLGIRAQIPESYDSSAVANDTGAVVGAKIYPARDFDILTEKFHSGAYEGLFLKVWHATAEETASELSTSLRNNSEAYVAFKKEIANDCATCFESKQINLGGEVAWFTRYSFQTEIEVEAKRDGFDASIRPSEAVMIDTVHNGRKVTLDIRYFDYSQEVQEIINTFIQTFEFTE